MVREEANRKDILEERSSSKGRRQDSEKRQGTALSRSGERSRGGKDSHGFREVIDREAGNVVFVLWRKQRPTAKRNF